MGCVIWLSMAPLLVFVILLSKLFFLNISANDFILILMGLLSARGGGLVHGGYCDGDSGGGGSGGRIYICYRDIYHNFYSTFDVSPGGTAEWDYHGWGAAPPEEGTVKIFNMKRFPFE